ncbi:MAG: secretion protein [Fretibacterium sp.]|nr:secretion protein [Fretibacterium sp.]
MRLSSNKTHKILLLTLLLSMSLPCVAALGESAGKGASRARPFCSIVEIYQLGDSELVVGLRGRRIPEPRLSFDGNLTKIVLEGTSFDSRAPESLPRTSPMLTHMEMERRSGDVVISLTTDRALTLRSKRGEAPSDSYTLRLITQEQVRKVSEESLLWPAPSPPVSAGPFSATMPVTLDLRDTELRDVFRLLGMHLKKNIIIDPSLPPALVTMTLKEVPLRDAFNYLMRTYDLGYHMLTPDIILVGTNDGLSKIKGNEETRLFHVSYADPVAIQALLVNLTHIPTDRMIVDPRMRTIYVTSNPTKLAEVATILQKLDHPGKQVMIQARILEFTDGESRKVEAAINAVYDHWWFKYMNGVGGIGYIDDNRVGRNYIKPDEGIFPVVTDPTTPLEGVWRELDVAFQGTESRGQGKTLASPSVITLDGQEATIKLTEDYPYITGRDEGGNPSWATQSVGPQMKLTPIVGRDGIITLNLTVETGEVLEKITGSGGEEMPRTSKRSVTTNVRVRNGEPFVIGGLFRDSNTNRRVRIPVLGQLPILGELFTYRYRDNQKSQVVMVIIPYILDTPDVAVEQELVMHKQ